MARFEDLGPDEQLGYLLHAMGAFGLPPQKTFAEIDAARLDARIASRSSVSAAEFPAWWAAYWLECGPQSPPVTGSVVELEAGERAQVGLARPEGILSAYTDVGQPSPVAHVSAAWVHAGGGVPWEPSLKTVFISHERAHAAVGALGIALLRVVDEEGQFCPLPLRPAVSSGAPEALQQILQAAAIPGFSIVVGLPAPRERMGHE